MSKSLLILGIYICTCLSLLSANDTVSVRYLQVPVLLNTSGNKIIDIHIKAGNAGKANKMVLSLDEDCDLKNIQSIALFYSGTVNYVKDFFESK